MLSMHFIHNTRIYITFIFLFYYFNCSAQQQFLERHAPAVKQVIEKNHVEPKAINDSLSVQLFERFINISDPEKLYFTTKDINALRRYATALDDEFNMGKWAFLTDFTTLYIQRLKQSNLFIEESCVKPFDYTKPDLSDSKLDTAWATDEKQLKDKWQRHIKFQVLDMLSEWAEGQLQHKGSINRNELLKMEPEARIAIRDKHLKELKETLAADQDTRNNLTISYLNTFLQCLDPHSSYFTHNDKDDFEQQLNSEGYFFGLSLGENDKHEVVITRLIPGGAAWMSGDLNKDDVILQLKWTGKDAVDVKGLSPGEVSALLDGPHTEKLEIKVRKTNGQTTSVTLQKTKLDNDENIVKSFLLEGDQTIGYISLPSFYTEWEESSGSKCAEDVAKEIIKLKKDNITGLILDLRFNGGGSLGEAIEMAGIFIDEGALTQLKTREPKPVILKDVNRGVIYSGPLVVLVKGQSASASELVAAALQDYNRALIVGSATFGKGSGQTILPLEYATTVSDSEKGHVKITNSRLYRVTGKSIQKTGVQPDILLPDLYDKFAYKEDAHPSALPADTIAAYRYFKPMMPLPVTALQSGSSARIKNSEKFKQLTGMAATIEATYFNQTRSLSWDDREKKIKTVHAIKNDIKNGFAPTSFYTPDNNSNDKFLLSKHIIPEELNKHWLQKLSKDIYIEECYLILSDFIKFKKP